MENDPSGRILLTWTSGLKKQKTATAKAAFLSADTPASQVQIKHFPLDPGTHAAVIRAVLVKNGPAVVILQSQRYIGDTTTTFSESVQTEEGDWSKLKAFHTTTGPITPQLGITYNGAGEIVACWASDETGNNFNTLIRSASGEWKPGQNDLKLKIEGGAAFSISSFGHNEFVLNFEQNTVGSRHRVFSAYLKNGHWYRKELRPKDIVGRAHAGEVPFWRVLSDPNGNFRLFWHDSERTGAQPNLIYTAQIDEQADLIEKTPIELTSSYNLRLKANSAGEVCALYEFVSGSNMTGIKVATATTITGSEEKSAASDTPVAATDTKSTASQTPPSATDSLPPLSPASAGAGRREPGEQVESKPPSPAAQVPTQGTPHTPKYPIEVVKTGQSQIMPKSIALDRVTTNRDGSPSLLIFDAKQRKIFRLRDGALEHIAGNGGMMAQTESSRSKTATPARETPLDHVQVMSVSPNGRIAMAIDPPNDYGRIITLIPRKANSNSFDAEEIACHSNDASSRNAFETLTSLVWLPNGELLFSSLGGIYRVDGKHQVTREPTARTLSNPGSDVKSADNALTLHMPYLRESTSGDGYLLIDPWFHKIFRLSGDLQKWVRVAGQGDLSVQKHSISRVRVNQTIEAAKQNAKRRFAGVSPDGTEASQARLNYPKDATEAPDGTIVFIEGGNLRGVDKNGKLFTIASDDELGIAKQRLLSSETNWSLLHDLTISPDGDCYVAQMDLGRVLKIKTGFAPRVSTVGGFQLSVLSFPRHLSPISENHRLVGFWVTEPVTRRILRLGVDGRLRNAFGGRPDADNDLGDGSDRSKWRFHSPVSINGMGRVNMKGDYPYLISDFGPTDSPATGHIRRLSADGKTLTTIAGNGKPAGDDLTTIPAGAKATDIPIRPITTHALAEHDEQGNRGYLLSDALRNQVLWITPSGDVKPAIGGGTQTPTPDWQPATKVRIGNITRIHPTKSGGLLVDRANHRIYEYNQPNQELRVIAGTGTPGYSGDNGPATAAQLNKPHDLRATNNKIFITDSSNHVIREINTDTGVITTIAGSGTPGNTTNTNNPLKAQFNNPTSIAVGKADIYILDTFNRRITKIKRD